MGNQCRRCGRYWWGEDVVPRILWKWRGITHKMDAGLVPPPGYGIAYHEWGHDELVYMPIPLNVLYALARRIWWSLQYLIVGNPLRRKNERDEAMFKLGYKVGMRDARRTQWTDSYGPG